jgi:hypothetical protein
VLHGSPARADFLSEGGFRRFDGRRPAGMQFPILDLNRARDWKSFGPRGRFRDRGVFVYAMSRQRRLAGNRPLPDSQDFDGRVP